jgi:hypothetical protein
MRAAGLLTLALLFVGCEPPVDGLVGITPEEGAAIPTNGVFVVETLGELAVEGERIVDDLAAETLVPLTTRCAGERCFTPVPVGPLPANADLVVMLRVGAEVRELTFDVGPVADRQPPSPAVLEGGPSDVFVRVSDADVTVVLVEDTETGRPLAGARAPPVNTDLELKLIDGVRCVSTLVMDHGGNVVLGEGPCF